MEKKEQVCGWCVYGWVHNLKMSLCDSGFCIKCVVVSCVLSPASQERLAREQETTRTQQRKQVKEAKERCPQSYNYHHPNFKIA